MAVTLLKVALLIGAILGAVRILHYFRARAMRRFALKWDLRYIGPTAPPQWWFNTSRPKIPSTLPRRFFQLGISQAWNIIEGEKNGTTVFVFDGISAGAKTQPCTYIACQTVESPFPITTTVEPVVQIREWTVLSGVWFLWFSWFMGMRRLNRHLRYLRPE